MAFARKSPFAVWFRSHIMVLTVLVFEQIDGPCTYLYTQPYSGIDKVRSSCHPLVDQLCVILCVTARLLLSANSQPMHMNQSLNSSYVGGVSATALVKAYPAYIYNRSSEI